MPTTKTRGGEETNTIIPYLFGGLGLLLALIAVALITLACSSRKKRHPSAAPKLGASVDDHQPAAPDVPRIVVIMAGDDKPTFLATAAPVNPPPLPPADAQV